MIRHDLDWSPGLSEWHPTVTEEEFEILSRKTKELTEVIRTLDVYLWLTEDRICNDEDRQCITMSIVAKTNEF